MSGPSREDKGNTIGHPIPGVSMRIVDDYGHDVRPGEEGELWARGPVIMKSVLRFQCCLAQFSQLLLFDRGYLNNPEATRDSFGPDGWLKTGDVAYVDQDGLFYIVDRRKEFIKYNAYQGERPKLGGIMMSYLTAVYLVAPATLEAILMGHPQVADCGVIGVASADGANELPKCDEQHTLQHGANICCHVTGHTLPRGIPRCSTIRPSLPKYRNGWRTRFRSTNISVAVSTELCVASICVR